MGQRASGRGSRGAMARTARRMRVIIGEPGLRSGAAARVGDAQVFQLGHRAVLGGQRAIETVVHTDTYASPESNPGGGHSGGADDGDGSACERTRIAWESG